MGLEMCLAVKPTREMQPDMFYERLVRVCGVCFARFLRCHVLVGWFLVSLCFLRRGERQQVW